MQIKRGSRNRIEWNWRRLLEWLEKAMDLTISAEKFLVGTFPVCRTVSSGVG